jgi:hypothetical protein
MNFKLRKFVTCAGLLLFIAAMPAARGQSGTSSVQGTVTDSTGAVAWVYLSELFPFAVRGKGQGFGALVHWIANAGLIWIFPVLEHAAPRGSFLFFALMMALQVAVVLLWYPETKGTSLGAVTELAPSLPRA